MIGDAVNLCSRVEAATRDTGDPGADHRRHAGPALGDDRGRAARASARSAATTARSSCSRLWCPWRWRRARAPTSTIRSATRRGRPGPRTGPGDGLGRRARPGPGVGTGGHEPGARARQDAHPARLLALRTAGRRPGGDADGRGAHHVDEPGSKSVGRRPSGRRRPTNPLIPGAPGRLDDYRRNGRPAALPRNSVNPYAACATEWLTRKTPRMTDAPNPLTAEGVPPEALDEPLPRAARGVHPRPQRAGQVAALGRQGDGRGLGQGAAASRAARRGSSTSWRCARPGEIAELLEMGRELRAAQEEMLAGSPDRAKLREAAQLRAEEGRFAAARAAEAIGREHGVGAQILTRVGETLQAAAGDPEVAEAIERGGSPASSGRPRSGWSARRSRPGPGQEEGEGARGRRAPRPPAAGEAAQGRRAQARRGREAAGAGARPRWRSRARRWRMPSAGSTRPSSMHTRLVASWTRCRD